jgi:hypothetical protein
MGLHDAYGNAISCPAGSIPMLRMSLGTMSGFPTLHAFLAKGNTIFYIPNNESGGTGVWSSLTAVQTNPACYRIKYTPSSKGRSWGTYFYYGGPGGRC